MSQHHIEGPLIKRASLPQAVRIVGIKVENAVTKTFTLADSLEAQPGQFVMAWLPGLEDKPFSLAGARPITLTIAAVGPFSRAIHQLQVGDLLWLRGPLGQGFRLPASGGHLLLIGGGYGVAPLFFLARQALAVGCRVSMIIGAATANSLLLADEFQALAVPLWLTTVDGSAGRPGLATDAIPLVLAHAADPPKMVYACGPIGMLQAVAAWCEAENLPAQLSWEAPMRCGLGLCGSCEVGRGWLTCLDGPVFQFNPLTHSP
ncbi:MAG: dihydroorotate dehydrogenase electron transfer subunit [Anaerolineae bacterium]|nr:dihydroorotate dehydrogenase electron transfer subunit [Anaerolineae bacterium]